MTPTVYDGLFWLTASRYAGGTGLDTATFAALLKATAAVESNFHPGAVGPTNDRGLMQLTDTTVQGLGYTGTLGDDATRSGGLYDPAVAIDLAGQLVRANLLGTHGNLNAAIAAYNEGLTRANQDAASGAPWRTTDPKYVPKVRAALDLYLPDLAAQGGAGLLAKGAL